MTADQLDLTPFYHLRYQAPSTLDLGPVGSYLLTRYGKDGRVVFAGPGAMQATLDKKERQRFLRFLRDHREEFRGAVVFDDGKRTYATKV